MRRWKSPTSRVLFVSLFTMGSSQRRRSNQRWPSKQSSCLRSISICLSNSSFEAYVVALHPIMRSLRNWLSRRLPSLTSVCAFASAMMRSISDERSSFSFTRPTLSVAPLCLMMRFTGTKSRSTPSSTNRLRRMSLASKLAMKFGAASNKLLLSAQKNTSPSFSSLEVRLRLKSTSFVVLSVHTAGYSLMLAMGLALSTCSAVA